MQFLTIRLEVLSAAKDAHTKPTKTTTTKVLKLSPKPKKTRAKSPDLLYPGVFHQWLLIATDSPGKVEQRLIESD